MAILKIQRSLAPVFESILVYDQAKAICVQLDLTPPIQQILAGRLKIYVEGEVVRDKLTIYEEVEAQPW